MQNCEIKIEGSKAIIIIDLTKEFGPSATGKTTVVASTRGNVQIAPGVKLGLNAYRPR